jgi:hypothetical protein
VSWWLLGNDHASLSANAARQKDRYVSLWVIPYVDQSLDFWAEIEGRFGAKVKEVYFPMPGGRFATGRSRQPEDRLFEFLRHVSLPKAVLVNPIVLPGPVDEMAPGVVAALQQLSDAFGVQSVTVTSLELARVIKESLPDFVVAASVLMGVASPLQALVVRDYVDVVAPDTSLVRDLAGLERLRLAFPKEIRLLVNEACIPRCPYRIQHFYEMGYGETFPLSLCQQMLEERPWLRLTGAWLLPRHLKHYDGLYDTLKLAGRVTLRDADRYLTVLDAYVHRKPILPSEIGGGPASPLEAFDISDEWFEYVLRCDKRCATCTICREHYDEFHRN